MNIIDLTHFISSKMPVYPDTESPEISDSNTIEKNGFAEKNISISSHTGTHVDAPAHMIKKSNTLDMFDINQFIGEGKVVDISGIKKKVIEKDDIMTDLEGIDKIDFILFYSGWSQYWGRDQYFRDYPVLSEELVKYLTSFKLKGMGFDVISIDTVGDVHFANHMIVFRSNMIIIENLKNLESLIGNKFTFFCLPLKFENSDGSPVRACAIME
jgi:arylformamidase